MLKIHQLKIKILKYQFTLLLSLWMLSPAVAQYKILEDAGALNKVHQAIDSIYNLNFRAADIIIADLDKKLGDYPGVLLLKAFYISWKFRPIKKEHESFAKFEYYLKQGIEKSEAMLEEDEHNIEANFFLLACHAYLAELYVNNGQNFKALGEAKNAYKYIKIGFDHVEDNPEFYFSSGIYNYYREKFPEENPFYKSFIWFFRSGDLAKGIKMLKQGADNAIFTKAECLTYLFHINLRYEDKPSNAIFYAKMLKDRYTNNLYYISNYIENSIRLKQYDTIYTDIELLLQSDKDFYRYLGEIFYGNYLEIKEKDFTKATKHYKLADQLGDKDKIRVPHFDSILYLGLGRINLAQGNIDLGNQYLKKSVKAAEYIAYRRDAQALLDK